MTDHLTTDPGYRLQYIVSHETYYASRDRKPTIVVQRAADEGGVAWEFLIVDYTEVIRTRTVHVEIFCDAFAAFAEIEPFFSALAAEQCTTLDEVREILDDFGFVDATEREEVRR